MQNIKFICQVLFQCVLWLPLAIHAETATIPAQILSPLTPLPDPVVVYSKAFAERIGLNPAGATQLDPGLYAIVLTFKKRYGLDISPTNPFIKRHHLDELTPQDSKILAKHLSIFPLLFKYERPPLIVHYDCYIHLYIKNDDKRLQNIDVPKQRMWDNETEDKIIHQIIDPIDQRQIMPIQSDDLTLAKGQQKPYSLLDYYIAYQHLTLPLALLAVKQIQLSNPDYLNQYNLTLDSYFYDFISGITYLSFKEPICANLVNSNVQKEAAALWIEKKTGPNPDSLRSVEDLQKLKTDDFYQFQLPAEITESTALKAIAPYSQQPLDNPIRLILPAGFFNPKLADANKK
jgi:hypothetical protein